MNLKIGRTLFYFKDGDVDGDTVLNDLNNRFFPFDNLLNRLLNETYDGKKIKFINILFSTEATYKLYPASIKYYAHYYNGHLNYNGLFDISSFREMGEHEQIVYIWNEAYKNLKDASIKIKNENLLQACEYAYKKGLEMNLNPDFKLLETSVLKDGKKIEAALWIVFSQGNEMSSKLVCKENDRLLYEKTIDKTKNGVEFFLEMYNKIEFIDSNVVIKGHREVEYLPLVISVF